MAEKPQEEDGGGHGAAAASNPEQGDTLSPLRRSAEHEDTGLSPLQESLSFVREHQEAASPMDTIPESRPVSPITATASPHRAGQEATGPMDTIPESRPVSPITGTAPLHRAGTFSAAQSSRNAPETAGEHYNANDPLRPRGRTISARPQFLAAQQHRELSPRSQLLKRPTFGRDNASGETATSGNTGASPARGPSQRVGRRRGSTTSERPSFTSPGMRPRMSTWAIGGPGPSAGGGGGIQRRGTMRSIQRSPTILNVGRTTGRDTDDQSQANFNLAGPGLEVAAVANQPYVDPGYIDLNPSYDQPENIRPVWGLARPLPRVIRPGMVPSRSELQVQIPTVEQQQQQQQQQQQDAQNVDLEDNRLEATLNVNKLSPQLQEARRQREANLLRTYSRRGQGDRLGLSPTSPSVQQPSLAEVLSSSSQVIHEEHEEGGGHDVGAERLKPTNGLSPSAEQPHEQSPWYPDDGASVETAKEQDDALDGDWIGEPEFPMAAYDNETDEIHNLHTRWSVIRLRFREPLAELLAVTVQLTLGFCADLVVTTGGDNGTATNTNWAWGLATMIGIYIAGGISGAHLNPAISIMLWIYRGFPLRKIPPYLLAQILGAFIAALIAFGLFKNDIAEYGGSVLADTGTVNAFITSKRYAWIDPSTAFFTEFTGTAILAVAVLALGDDTNAPPGAGMNAFILGLIITVLSMCFGYNTGCALNPARDLGPRLATLALGYGAKATGFDGAYWFYGPWCGTIAGALFGAFLYDAAIFVGGESPVNYPRRRIKRASKKWNQRMKRRVQNLTGRREGRGKYEEMGDREK